MGWNLPPDCFISDIPGNRPEDELWERFLGELNDPDIYPETTLALMFDDWLSARRDDPSDG